MWYALIVAMLSLAGAAVPLRRRPSHAQLQIYLSLAAGALLGAAMFHLLPESSEHIHESFGLPALLGIGVVFFLQRYLAPHSHEPPHDEVGVCATECGHDHGHEHHHDHSHSLEHAGNARAIHAKSGGLLAIAALSIHSFFDGVAIGAVANASAPGAALAVFLSVLIHKPMDGLTVSVLLMNAGVKPKALWATQIVYALLVPVGALAFMATSGAVAETSPLVGYTLAFSAGTFLAIALTDLLPELHFHEHDRNKLSAALLLGLVVMWATSLIGHSNGHSHGPAKSSEVDQLNDGHDHDHAHEHEH